MEQIQKGKRALATTDLEADRAAKWTRPLAIPHVVMPAAAIDTVQDKEELNRRQEELEGLERVINQKASTIVILEQEWKVSAVYHC